MLATPLGYVQGGNWDPSVGSDAWARFCDVLGSGKAVHSGSEIVRKRAVVLNYAKWVRKVRALCLVHLVVSDRPCDLATDFSFLLRIFRKLSRTAQATSKTASALTTTPSSKILIYTSPGAYGSGRSVTSGATSRAHLQIQNGPHSSRDA